MFGMGFLPGSHVIVSVEGFQIEIRIAGSTISLSFELHLFDWQVTFPRSHGPVERPGADQTVSHKTLIGSQIIERKRQSVK